MYISKISFDVLIIIVIILIFEKCIIDSYIVFLLFDCLLFFFDMNFFGMLEF